MFCPECKSLLLPKKEDGKTVLICSCGYRSDKSDNFSLKEGIEKTQDVEVVDSDIETLPITKEECPKCGHMEAYYWLVQTRSGDEAETKFLKCVKCKHTWRDYS